MAKKLIPFKWLPGSWGLKGDAFEKARIEYELDGVEKKVALAQVGLVDNVEKELAKNEVLLQEGEITQSEADKEKARITKEPWVEVKRMEVNPDDPKAGYMELDWNEHFVAMLQEKGYVGKSDEDVVNKWFNDICRTVLMQELEDQDYGLEQMERVDVVTVKDPDDE